MTQHSLQQLWQRGTALLGSEHAIMGGAMSWVSERNLVSALSNAGAFGVIAASSMPPELLDVEIKETKKLLKPMAAQRTSPSRGEVDASASGGGHPAATLTPTRPSADLSPLEGGGTLPPFGVNLIIMHPKLAELVEVCIANRVTHVVLAGGVPKGPTITRLKDGGAKVICFAPTAALGKKLVKMGADALIIEGAEAGGHIGPVSTSVLAQEILPVIRDVPVFVAGGIGRGEMIATYLEMGAAGVQLGTRFVCAKESIAHENFKKAFLNANARDAMPSVQYHPDFNVIPVRAIVNKASEEFTRFQKETVEKVFAGAQTKEEGQLAIEHFWAGSLRRAVIEGDIERGSLMAGQSVGMVNSIQSAQEIIDELVAQASEYLAR
jgi:enoyl-[acyl-carrier protein] reductase II